MDMERPNNVLVVEDDFRLTLRLGRFFRTHFGLVPERAHNLEDAEARLRDQEFGLVVMDNGLPRTRAVMETNRRSGVVVRDTAREITGYTREYDFDPEAPKPELVDARWRRAEALSRITIAENGGVDLIRRIREENGLNRRTPTLFLLTSGSSGWPEVARKVISWSDRENTDWVVKPVPGERLFERCTRLLGKA